MAFIAIIGCQNGSTTQNEYKNQSVVTETQPVREYSNEEKAFAGAAFGMSMNDVKSLEYYNDWRVSGNRLINESVELGFFTHYKGTVWFSDNKLYYVSFESTLPWPASTYKTVEDELTNFKEVIEKTYGKPTKDYGIPSISKVKQHSNTACVWDIGNKGITLCINKSPLDETYYFYATIVDVSAMNRIKKEGKEKIENKKKDASSLF